jgi:hypothetical protein
VTKDVLLAAITTYYLDSRDFNGLPVVRLDIPRQQLEPMLRALIEDGLVSIPVTVGNPHIRAFPSAPIEAQLAELDRVDDLTHVVAYPEPKHLEASVDRSAFEGQPYTLRLALGAGQLEPAFFELSILEQYRNDPRYRYDTNETAGTISVADEHYASEAMREADKVILQTFGFGYDDAMHRAVCVFNRYLSDLSPEHQQIWKARELAGGYKLHPAYYASSILGEFPDGISMFDAFLEELELLKAMPEAVDLPPLVRESFRGRKPGNFTFLIRPTLKELQDFHATLDKMMSQNLNKRFLVHVLGQTAAGAADKGTIQLLEEWLGHIAPGQVAAVSETFREVRKLRQRPAHGTDDNVFDLVYYEQQRELMERSYAAARVLRLILTSHFELAGYEVPEWLEDGKIYRY